MRKAPVMSDATTLDRTESPPTRLRVSGMDCASCAVKVEHAVRRLPGIEEIQVSVATETLTVRHGSGTDARAIAATVRSLGYGAENPAADAMSDAERPELVWWRAPKALLAFACGAALVLAFAIGKIAPATERWAFLAAMAVGLVPIARRAVVAARHGTPFSIEMLMTIAAVGAVPSGPPRRRRGSCSCSWSARCWKGWPPAGPGPDPRPDRPRAGTALIERDGRRSEVPAERTCGRGDGAGAAGRPGPGGRTVSAGRARSTRRRSPARACRGGRARAIRCSPAP